MFLLWFYVAQEFCSRPWYSTVQDKKPDKDKP